MAIFRAGKRVGIFDIRGGISRGDYKSSAYHKTDRDPRFKMRANTDNTIGRFRSAMNSAEGYARPARFAVKLFLPSNLSLDTNFILFSIFFADKELSWKLLN